MTKAGPPRIFTWDVQDTALWAIMAFYVLIAPYTKVEESFNLQATHDFLYNGHDVEQFDHHAFPGVVPRTFLGPLLLATASAPLAGFFTLLPYKLPVQYIVRIVLGSGAVFLTGGLRRMLQWNYGGRTGLFFWLFTATSFHTMFYASRTTPNTFAGLLFLVAFNALARRRFRISLAALAFCAAAFRFDTLLYLAPLTVYLLERRFVKLIPAGLIIGGIAAITAMITFEIDSDLWGRWCWPELEVFWFNVIENKSSEWGVSPAHWYFTSALPRAALPAVFVLSYSAIVYRSLLAKAKGWLVPAIAMIVLYSLMPHKELRFILPAIPALQAGAAVIASHLWSLNSKRGHYFRVIVAMTIATAAFGLFFFTTAAKLNYPGGEAIYRLHADSTDHPEDRNTQRMVWIDNLPAQTGVSRFTELQRPSRRAEFQAWIIDNPLSGLGSHSSLGTFLQTLWAHYQNAVGIPMPLPDSEGYSESWVPKLMATVMGLPSNSSAISPIVHWRYSKSPTIAEERNRAVAFDYLVTGGRYKTWPEMDNFQVIEGFSRVGWLEAPYLEPYWPKWLNRGHPELPSVVMAPRVWLWHRVCPWKELSPIGTATAMWDCARWYDFPSQPTLDSSGPDST